MRVETKVEMGAAVALDVLAPSFIYALDDGGAVSGRHDFPYGLPMQDLNPVAEI